MTTPSAYVEAHRSSIPLDIGTVSSSDHASGALMLTDVFLLLPLPADGSGAKPVLPKYIEIVTPVVRHMRAYKECLFCEISVNPGDESHIRVLHGWTRGSAWFKDNIETQTWFGDYIKSLAPIVDRSRSRVVHHFNRIPIE